ncbi:MAG: dTDP-4-dehydrorhamnose 3,5-epimerase [Acidobacteria bacterium]|nr:dTDP-4-dehydrorhamnose 3,5-epimerase [Acidobacteriota bacterium]
MGIHADFRQAIQSTSRCGVVRGLHFQWEPAQGKLVRCVAGRVFDVVVDVRHGSPTLGDHAVVELSEDNRQVIWISPGFAHGFLAQQERSIVLYECTAEWAPEGEGGILWDDPALGIQWPAQSSVTVSEKDRRQPTLDLWLRDPRSRKFMFPGQPA